MALTSDFDLARRLFGTPEQVERQLATSAQVVRGRATADSGDGVATVVLDADAEGATAEVEVPTSNAIEDGDEVLVTIVNGSPVECVSAGSGDRMAAAVQDAHDLAASVESIAQEAAAEVEQVRQDVADFRSDVATTYATKVEREDGDDAVKTWVTTNYTNSNDLATTYATKTLVSQTKDAIELAASQTYETQSDAAATYATKSALTVGLDGIRTEVAEDYQPKGDYATTASMNSAIQQSASSIESSVAATYETKSDAAATYATKTEVQQTASGLDTRITTATNTANSAKSAVDNLKVGGTNLLWDSAFDDIANAWLKWGTPTTYEVVNVNGVNYLHVKTSGARYEGIRQNDSKRAGIGEISAGEKFVFSVDAYGATNTQLNVGIHWLNSSHGIISQNWFVFNIGTTPKRYVHVDDLTAPNNAVAFNIMIGNNTTDVRELWFARPMLERGTLATDWSPAPEDMATEADLQAEVTERQTLIRQFSGGVLAGYVGNAIAALVNAAGSFDVVRTAWANGVPSILGTLARYAASGISLFDAAGNILAEFASDHVRVGGDVPDGTGVESTVQFFDQTETHDTDMTASTYFDGGSGYQTMRSTVNLSSTLADEGKTIDTGSSGTAALDLSNALENGISATGEQHNEVIAALVSDASYSDGTATSHAAVRATATTTNGSHLSHAELIADSIGIGTDESSIDYYTTGRVNSTFMQWWETLGFAGSGGATFRLAYTGTWLLVTAHNSTAGANSIWILRPGGNTAFKMSGGQYITVTVSGTSVTVKSTNGTVGVYASWIG